MADSPLIDSLRRAVATAPDDVPLLVHLSEVLLDGGHNDEAIGHLASAIRLDGGSAQARELMARALAPPGAAPGGLQPPTGAGAMPPSPAGPVPPVPGDDDGDNRDDDGNDRHDDGGDRDDDGGDRHDDGG
ncbi:MAG: tetratricopeptide repeat protein, partial [Acidimicrobiales bacterium]|nr:tetratricopeptide repeat protein [Acidimicrobiales bacterium]